MQRSFRVRLKAAGVVAALAVTAALLYGCGDKAKEVAPENKSKMMEMMNQQKPYSQTEPGRPKGAADGGGANSPR